jgi:hypothetical protein
VLVVTTTMRMVNGVHSNTTSTRPAENSVMVELKRLGKRTHL